MTHNAMLQAEVTRLRKSRTDKLVSTVKSTGPASYTTPTGTEPAMSTEPESHSHHPHQRTSETSTMIHSEKSRDTTGSSYDTSHTHQSAYAQGSSKALLRAMQAGASTATKPTSVPTPTPPIDAHELFAQLNDVLSDESLRLLLSYLENYHSGNLSIDSFLTRAQVVRMPTLAYTYTAPVHTCLQYLSPVHSFYLKQLMLVWQLNYMHSWSSSFVWMLPLRSCAMHIHACSPSLINIDMHTSSTRPYMQLLHARATTRLATTAPQS